MGFNEVSELNNQIKDNTPTVAPVVGEDVNADSNSKGNGTFNFKITVNVSLHEISPAQTVSVFKLFSPAESYKFL